MGKVGKEGREGERGWVDVELQDGGRERVDGNGLEGVRRGKGEEGWFRA